MSVTTSRWHSLTSEALGKSNLNLKQILTLFIGALCLFLVSACTIALYSHYGPLTPNGNRYYHSFNMDTVIWGLVALEFGAMMLLTYPSIRYALSCSNELRGAGIFPSRGTISKWISRVLSVLCIGSQVIFTLFFYLEVREYLSNHSRVMAEDFETAVQYFAYFLCICFWGIINLGYSIWFKLKW